MVPSSIMFQSRDKVGCVSVVFGFSVYVLFINGFSCFVSNGDGEV